MLSDGDTSRWPSPTDSSTQVKETGNKKTVVRGSMVTLGIIENHEYGYPYHILVRNGQIICLSGYLGLDGNYNYIKI
jgi:hypothetical protein